ncbi:MFS transporter [Azonexus hydrophilus]|uniref:MFS transporter n=1 Tax=Azonexus hydrophilus TaxID=418702 RepID=UPI002492E473|nr:nitrate/nitrite transporter [Azonexus hydrophilus]
MTSRKMQQLSVLTMSTLAFTVCFMVWMIFAVIGIPIKEQLGLNETQFGILAAMPVLTGSLIRLPLGMMTDRFGGRPVFFGIMMSTVLPIYLIGQATEYWQLLVAGLFVGIAYCARWFEKQNQGFAMGVFGAGNAGAALTKLLAPSIVVAYGWTMVPTVFAVMMLVTALAFFVFTYSDPAHRVSSTVTVAQQLRALKDPNVWKICQYYSIVFGGYVALALWMTKYYVQEYGFDLTSAAFLAACFSLPGGVLRALGGWFSDKFGAHKVTWWVLWVCWICLFILSYPQTEFTVKTVTGPQTYEIHLNEYVFTALLFVVGVAMAVGKASVFKYISDDYPKNIGVISGIVGLAGGLGGFLLPIMFGALVDLTGVRSSCFMLLYGVVWVSLIWMYWTEVRDADLVRGRPARVGADNLE